MTDQNRAVVLEASVDTTVTRTGFAEIGQQAGAMAASVARSSQQATTAVGGIGGGADAAARKMEAVERSFVGSIQRQIAAIKSGAKGTSDYIESLARLRNVDPSGALAPYLSELRAVEVAQRQSVVAVNAGVEAQTRAAEAARVAAVAQRELAQAQAGRDSFLSGLREQISLYGRSADEVLRLRAAQLGVGSSAAPLILQLQNVRAAHDQVAQSARDQEKAQRQALQAQAGRDSFVASLQQQAAAIGKTRVQLLELQAAQHGVTAEAAPYLAQLRAVEVAQQRAAAANASGAVSLNNVGMSARATAAALRGVPAQVTDIVTSLQGGQAPLTVFLQQGGQLKDMFGGVGNAAKALGGYVLGLVTPTTVAAAAVVALGIAHHAGAAEAEGYKRALILSGNAAGATSNQLADISRTIGLVSGSQRVAAEAVTAIAGTGRVSVDDLQKFGAAAVEVQKVIGRSIADTATEFASLGKTPLTALEQINEKYRFITAATYAQVKALQDQGRASEAAKVAQNAYADAITSQKDKILASLTDWERGWIRIKTATSGAVDAAIDLALGRQATGVQKITAALAERELIEKRISVAVSKGDAGKEAQFRADLAQNAATINGLRAKEKAAKDGAAAEAAGIKVAEAKNKWLKDGDQYLSRAAQLEREITVARNEGAAAQLSASEIEARVGGIRKKYADIFNDGIDSNIEALKRRAAVEDVLSKRALAQVQANRAAGSITEDAAITQTTALELAAFDKKRVLIEQELALAKNKQNSLKQQAELSGQLAVLDAERLSRTIQQTQDLFALEQKRFRLAVENTAKIIEGAQAERESLLGQNRAQIDANDAIGLTKVQLGALTAARLEELAARKDAAAFTAEGLDLDGQLAGIYREQAAALRERAKLIQEGAGKEFMFDEWKAAVDTYSNVFRTGFADMLNHGRAGWQSFTKSLVTTFKTSVADQIYKMFAQPFVVQLVGSFLGVTGSGLANAAQGLSGAGNAASVAGQAPSIVSTAANAYSLISGGMTIAGGVGTGFVGSVAGGLMGAGAGAGLTSSAGLAIGESIASVVGPTVAGALSTGIGAIAAAAPYIAIAVAGAALLKSAFGHGERQTTATSLNGSFGAMGFSGTTDASWKEKGGWFSSDKTGITKTAIDDPTAKALASAYDQIKTASADFAATLGINASSIKNRTQSLSVALTEDKAANQKAVADFFVGVGDTIAKELLPTISDFSKAAAEFGGVGESASATLQRIAGDYAFIDVALASINTTFGAVGVGSIAAREHLLDLSGGLDAFGKGVAGFAQNYLTEAERLKPVAATVDAALAALGFVGDKALKTRDDFKAAVMGLVDGGKLATEAGAATYAGLIKVQDGFAQLHPLVNAAAEALASTNKGYQDQIDGILKASMSAAELRAFETKGMDESTVALYDRLAGLKAEAEATKLASDAIQKAKDAAIASAKANADALQAFGNGLVGTMKNLTDAAKALRDFNSSLLSGSDSTLDLQGRRDEAAKRFAASPGDTAAASALIDAAKALRDAGGGGLAYARDFAQVIASNAGQAASNDAQSASIPAFYRAFQEAQASLQPTPAPAPSSGWDGNFDFYSKANQQAMVSTVPAQIYSSAQPVPITSNDMVSRAEFQQVQADTALALSKIATSTAAMAETLNSAATGQRPLVTEAA